MKKLNFIIILIGIAILSRLIPHPPNFTPITAIALFSTIHFKNKIYNLFYSNYWLIYF